MRYPVLKYYIDDFNKLLDRISVNDISPELYCRKYLSHILLHKRYYLAIYADVLFKLIRQSGLSKENISLIDFGAGNGLLGIFAKFCGFKKVWINDIDPAFINAAQNLAGQLDLFIDGYIAGDISSVRSYLKNEIPNAIVGTDVIEHIYNLEDFFSILHEMNPSAISVFTTASNPENYFKVRQLKKIQLKDELEGGDPGEHALFGHTPLEPFLKIREQVIRDYQQGMKANEITRLAVATRGMNKEDIRLATQHYQRSGKFPAIPADTNTCNPLNGSWTERILPLKTYISLYDAAGFTCKFYAGFYNEYEAGSGNFVKKLLNNAITILGKKISPYIVIVGYRK